MIKYVVGVLFALTAALPYLAMVWTGGGGDETDGAPVGDRIRIMSPHRREVRQEYGRGFRQWMRERHGQDVTVEWLDAGGTSKILKDLESRFATSPSSPGVDIMFGGGVAPYLTAVEQGWLQPVAVPEAILGAIPPICAGAPVYDVDRRWFGVALSGFGILYNQPLIDGLRLPVPRDWEDLARPEYYSWVGSGDPRSSGSVHMCYEIILQAYGFEKGWDIITRLCANVRTFGESGGTVPREVAVGETAAGMVIDQYAQTVVDAVGGGRLVFVLPEAHTVIGPDAIGVIRGAESEALSRRFVEFVLSPEGQRILYQPIGANGQRFALYRMPVVEALYAEPAAPRNNPYRYPAGLRYDDALGSARWNPLNDLMGVWLIDAHADLKQAWQAVVRAGLPEDGLRELSRVPLKESELTALSDEWKDSRRRQEIMHGWALEAQTRYRALTAAGGRAPDPVATRDDGASAP